MRRLTAALYADALDGFKEVPPRHFQYNGRTARDKESLDFIWQSEGLEPGADGPDVPIEDPNAEVTPTSVAKSVPAPTGDEAVTRAPRPNYSKLDGKALRVECEARGLELKKRVTIADMIELLKADDREKAKLAKKAAKTKPTEGEAMKPAPFTGLRAELETLSDEDLKGRAVASGIDSDAMDRNQTILAVIEAES